MKCALRKLSVYILCLLKLHLVRTERTHLDGVGLLQYPLSLNSNIVGPAGNDSMYNTAIHGGRHVSGSYKTLTDNRGVGLETEHIESYDLVQAMLSSSEKLSHSRHILKYVTRKDYAPSLLKGGCLYLPSDKIWSSFYSYVEHPYPPLFAEMIANSFFPDCGNTSLSGLTMDLCPGGHISGSNGCFEATHSGTAKIAEGIHVYATDGHVGLPGKWHKHIHVAKRKPNRRNRLGTMPKDTCSKSWELPEVPSNQKLVVPLQFVVCTTKFKHPEIDREMLKEQADWMNKGYAGHTPWEKMPFDASPPPQVDMQIEFDLYNHSCNPTLLNDCYRIKFVLDKDCAQNSFFDTAYAAKHNPDPTGLFTVVFVTDDESGILGMAEFPMETHEGDENLIVMVNTLGLRHFSARNKNSYFDDSYDEGDTATHEAGHSLGLYHTFEGGCALDGDMVADTNPESFPMYTCEQEKSCGSDDPLHDFMDYPPDACMNGFTELQKRRVWCVFENYRPKLFAESFRQL